jgi:hypothetical protein
MRLSTRIVLISAAVSVAALAIALAVYVIFVKVPTDLAHNAAEGMCGATSMFTPEVRLNETVVVQQSCANSGTGNRLQVTYGRRYLHTHLFGQHENSGRARHLYRQSRLRPKTAVFAAYHHQPDENHCRVPRTKTALAGDDTLRSGARRKRLVELYHATKNEKRLSIACRKKHGNRCWRQACFAMPKP